MNVARRRALTAVSGVLLSMVLATTVSAQQTGKKHYVFKGKVEKVDARAKTLTVANENIPGWMMAMTMTYGVDKDTALKNVQAGDQITATVYEDNFKTLYDVKVVPPDKKK